MSWSIYLVGTPDGIARELESHSDGLKGDSLTEYNEVKPHLLALVKMNVFGVSSQVLHLQASGSAVTDANGVKTYSNCNVSLNMIYGILAT